MKNPTKGLKRIQVVSIQMVKERNAYYESKTFDSPKAGAKIIGDFIGNVDREVFVVACLNSALEITNLTVAHMGTLSVSAISTREIFKTAILSNANSIIVAHNHPSGNLKPSPEDIKVTKIIATAGQILDIHLLDHLITNMDGDFVSLKEQGYM